MIDNLITNISYDVQYKQHLERDGPRKDQSGRKSAEGSETHVESLPQQQPWKLGKSKGGGLEGGLAERELIA